MFLVETGEWGSAIPQCLEPVGGAQGARGPLWGYVGADHMNSAYPQGRCTPNRTTDNHNPHEIGFVKPLVRLFSASRYGEPTTLGDFIRKARLEKGMKQAEVANSSSCNQPG